MEGLGIGTINGGNKLSVSGGNANFGGTASFQAATTFNNNVLISSSGRIYQSTTGNRLISINQNELFITRKQKMPTHKQAKYKYR